MTSSSLKKKLKARSETMNETHRTRLHRAISWLKAAEEQDNNADLQFIALWISYNACYAIDEKNEEELTEREYFNEFIAKLNFYDKEERFFKVLWEKYSGPVRLLIENEFLYKPFWDYQRTKKRNWKAGHEKSIQMANSFLAKREVTKLMEVVLDRLYTLRNQILHGGATYKSKVNRAQVRDANNILKLLVPIVIDIMIEQREEDWGEIYYPVVGNS
jgi:hypothetical protein